jgi:multicomponent Na+:H+ antiporter subunit B
MAELGREDRPNGSGGRRERTVKILVLIAAPILCLAPLLAGRDSSVDSVHVISLLVGQSGIPNTVSAVILQARLYDTIGEVVVFTMASLAVRWLLSDAPRSGRSRR